MATENGVPASDPSLRHRRDDRQMVENKQRCAYSRCGKLFDPKPSNSPYCSKSCASTAHSLKRYGCVK